MIKNLKREWIKPIATARQRVKQELVSAAEMMGMGAHTPQNAPPSDDPGGFSGLHEALGNRPPSASCMGS
eukprot:4695684-Amphidinium_carterae.1